MKGRQRFLSDHQALGDSALATVVAIVSAAVMLPFGESVIGVQLAAIADTFDVQGALLQWVVNVYMLTFATSILAVGILADRLGRRRLFAMGLVLIGSANVLAVFTPSVAVLIALRAVTGLGAGTVLATAPALLSARFPSSHPFRTRAFAAYGSAVGGGIAFGPLLGGLVMSFWGWRTVFAVYLPFVLLALVLLPRLAPSRGDATAPVDGMGITLFTLALAVLIWVIEGGPGSLAGQILLVAGAGALAVVLIWVERRHDYPAVDPALFASPVFRAMSLLLICWQVGVAVSMVYVPAVVIAGLGGSPSVAGASVLPMAILLFLLSPLGPWLVNHMGVRGFVGICIGFMVLGEVVIWWALTLSATGAGAGLVVGMILIGIGGGAANGSVDNLAMSTTVPGRAGMAAGVFQTVRIGAAALSIAVAGSVLEISGHVVETAGTVAPVATRYGDLAGAGALFMSVIAVICVVMLSQR